MRFLHLIWRNLLRKKWRTFFTMLTVLVAFVLFGFLAAIRLAFSLGVDVAGADRLLLIHKVSLIMPLPESYGERIRQIEGVVDATHSTWFGGSYQDPDRFFPRIVVEPEGFLRLYPEYVLPEEQKEAWFANRTGAIVGRKTAERFGWEIGDRIPLRGDIWRNADGDTWEFVIEGIYEGSEPGVDETQLLFHYDYFDEARVDGEGLVGWYVIRVDDPENAAEIAERIDAEFANSRYETKTATEKAFVQSFAKQIGDVGAILTAVLGAVFFTILLVTGNTMAQSVRERTSELAVLKTLGFTNRAVLVMVLSESVLLALTGGLPGLALGWVFVNAIEPALAQFLSVFFVPPHELAIGAGLALLLGVAAGSLPGIVAMRLTIVDALRRS